jgi:DNA-binding Xre family transcriptional regulator
MIKLSVKEVAELQGYTISSLQRATLMPMGTTHRYWHGIGKSGEPLTSVDLRLLDTLCDVLHCAPGDLLRKVPEGEPHHETATTH